MLLIIPIILTYPIQVLSATLSDEIILHHEARKYR